MQEMERAWAEVNLDAIAHNVNEIKKCLKDGVLLMGVVKADAYGHGVKKTAEVLLENGADRLAVAFVDEAVQLREFGFSVPILILGRTSEASIPLLIEHNITPAVFTVEFAAALSEAAVRMGVTAKIHIKLDTGMFRIGFPCTEKPDRAETIKKIMKISSLPNLEIEGIFTHFSTADEVDIEYTEKQFENFCQVVDELKACGVEIPIRHVANSATQIRFPKMQLDMVRAGIILYGFYPSDCVDYGIKLVPAMKFCARVVNITTIKKGCGVSYGRSFVADRDMRIATISVGYADGYMRLLSNKAEVSFENQRLKQIGRICMDQCMIDVTNVNNINIGDTVTLFGDAVVSADDIAGKLGTINYEISCIVGKRVPRVYIKDGIKTDTCNYLI